MADSVPIVCPYCGVGCNLDLALDENGRPVKCRISDPKIYHQKFAAAYQTVLVIAVFYFRVIARVVIFLVVELVV